MTVGAVTTVAGTPNVRVPDVLTSLLTDQEQDFASSGVGRWANSLSSPVTETVSRVASPYYSDPGSLKISTISPYDPSSPFYGLGASSTGAQMTGVPVTPSRILHFRARCLKDVNAGGADTYGGPATHFNDVYARCVVTFYTSGGTLINSTPGSIVIASTTEWLQLPELVVPVPADAATATLIVTFVNQGSGYPYYEFSEFAVGSTFYVDQIVCDSAAPGDPGTTSVATALFDQPIGIAVDPSAAGVLYVTESAAAVSRVRRVDLVGDEVRTVAQVDADNGDPYYYARYQAEGFWSVAVAPSGDVFALRVYNKPDHGGRVYELWRIHADGSHDVVLTHDSTTTSGKSYRFDAVVVDSDSVPYLAAVGTDYATGLTFMGVLKFEGGTLMPYASSWIPSPVNPSVDGPLVDARFDFSGRGYPFFNSLAIDDDDNIWVAEYRCIRKISRTEVTTPVGLIRDFSGYFADPVDSAWVLPGGGGPGGRLNRQRVKAFGGTFTWALAVTGDAVDPHVFTWDDYQVIKHAAVNADVCGTYLSGERIIRDNELGREAASYSCMGMAYADGFVYFTERYGPTIRRLEVGGAGGPAPRVRATPGPPTGTAHRR